jgi:hypothetical protein
MDDLHRPERDDGDLNTPQCQRVAGKLLLELLQAGVELGYGASGHGAGDIEHQHARAARLWVVDKGDIGKGHLGQL